jgi:hypothetical protein
MSKFDDGGPAFPVPGLSNLPNGDYIYPELGMNLRQYAAIKLRVPNSGTDWLDEMIRTSLRDEFAAKAMQGMAGSHGYCERGWDQKDLAGQAYELADAMFATRGEEK